MATRKYLIVIAGPTAVGKTDVAISVAQHFNTSVISADSRQCYREMTIGTAKPSQEELDAVPHFFIDSHSIHDHLNAADYERLALGYCAQIFADKDIAVVCGGTGLYVKALCEGLDEMPPVDAAIDREVLHDYEAKGIDWLREAVRTEDPVFFEGAEQQNPMRLLRALSFYRTHKVSINQYRSGLKKSRPFEIIKIGLELPRELLYQRINSRVDKMMEDGLLEEVIGLYPYRDLKNLQTVGYSEFWQSDSFPPRGQELDAAINLVKQHSRNYAKRQLTWFKKDNEFQWFSPLDKDVILQHLAAAVDH